MPGTAVTLMRMEPTGDASDTVTEYEVDVKCGIDLQGGAA